MERNNLEDHVQPGDVVIDVGARDGVFVAKALRRGASKVLAIEPDPRHLECLRRNFHGEIAFGRVVVAPVGAWSEEGTRALDGTGGREAPVTRIDTLVEDLKLARVHFIRIGIEGAEREALQGALGTLRTDRPRVMLELRRRRGDPAGLRRLLRSAHADYQPSCGPCRQGEEREGELLPQVVYFR
jgi:FkbM family methyltransferase